MQSLKKIWIYIAVLLLPLVTCAQWTIHVFDPWGDGEARLLDLGAETGWWPGATMTNDGNGWYSYTLTTTLTSSTNPIVIGRNVSGGGKEYYSFPGFTVASVFSGNPTESEFWVKIPDLTGAPEVFFGQKEIFFFSPWSSGKPELRLNGGAPLAMGGEPGKFGWFGYVLFDTPATVNVLFENSTTGDLYGDGGHSDATPIDVTDILDTADAVWIMPRPFPEGAPQSYPDFPDTVKTPKVIKLGAVIRDKEEGIHAGFGETSLYFGGKTMIRNSFDAFSKPQWNPSSIHPAIPNFDEWFVTEDFTGALTGYDNSYCYDMVLTENEDGLYEIDAPFFFPSDSMRYLDEARTLLNPYYSEFPSGDGGLHNFYFTMELFASFVYVPGQTFTFRGDDDVWLFINDSLVMDIGGVHGPESESVNLDDLGLIPGNTYDFTLFFCERHQSGSSFRMATSIDLVSESQFFHEIKDISPEETEYSFKEKVSVTGLACDNSETIDTISKAMHFSLKGRGAAGSGEVLSPGVSYGGITISPDMSSLKIGTDKMFGLVPGVYDIFTFVSSDPNPIDTITFEVVVILDPQLQIHSSVPDLSSFQMDTTVYLHVTAIGDTVDALIYYTIDYDGIVALPDSTTGMLYDPLVGIEIDSTATIYAIAYKIDHVVGDNNWSYLLDILGITITATPSAVPTYYFGGSIDTIKIVSSGPSGTALPSMSQRWVLDTFPITDTARFALDGTVYNRLTAFPYITSSDRDTLYLSVIAQEDGYVTTVTHFQYIRLYLPEIIADPYHIDGVTFSGDTTVSLSIAATSSIYENLRIQYILTNDSTDVITLSDRVYLNPIDFDSTVFVKAIALADNAVSSPVFVGLYRVGVGVVDACYYDTDGDGAIDGAQLTFSNNVIEKPTDISLTSPFDGTETRMISDVTLTLVAPNQLEVTFATSFSYTGETGFGPMSLGSLKGPEYLSETFQIRDSVAPVIRSATYAPGEIVSTSPLTRAADTLNVIYSEEVSIADLGRPVQLFESMGSLYFIDYESTLLESIKDGSSTTTQATYVVDSTMSPVFPQEGDSVNITASSFTTGVYGEIQGNENNRRVPLTVKPSPYHLEVVALSPVNPEKETIPKELQPTRRSLGHGIVIVADFYTHIDSDELNAKVTIYDALGSALGRTAGIGSTQTNLFVERRDEGSTKLFMYWNCRNRNGRDVGPGAYMAMIEIDDGHGERIPYKIMLGVRE